MTPEQAREQTPGVYQIGGEVGNLKKPNGKAAAKNANAAAGPQVYRVVGQIVGSQQNKMMVQAGGVRIQMELDPKVAISVNSRDTTFCQQGDQVNVSGLRVAGREQFIQAESLEIVGSKPLGPAEGKAAKNAKSSDPNPSRPRTKTKRATPMTKRTTRKRPTRRAIPKNLLSESLSRIRPR